MVKMCVRMGVMDQNTRNVMDIDGGLLGVVNAPCCAPQPPPS